VIALLPLLTLHVASVVVAPGPDEGCPSSRQVEAALARTPYEPNADTVLTLVLPPPATPMEPSFSLVDDQGRLKLFRSFAKPGGARPRACAALADTIAIIVQRYMEELEVPSLPPPAEPPRLTSPLVPGLPESVERRPAGRGWDLGLMGTLRVSNHTPRLSDFDGQLSVGRTFTVGNQPFEVVLSGGMAVGTVRHWDGGDGTLWRLPASLAALWRRSMGRVELQLGPVFLADVLYMRAVPTNGYAQGSWRLASAGGFQGAVHIQARRLFVRFVAEAAAAVVRFEYVAPSPADGTVLSTPAFFGNLRIALGLSFR
jgi:hypothetical protein